MMISNWKTLLFLWFIQKYSSVVRGNGLLGALCLAVSSPPKPCMDVFALPEKSNMAVTESNPDPKVRKMSITLSWACGLGTEILLILKNLYLTWLLPDMLQYDSPKKCLTILYAVNLWLKPVSATAATLSPVWIPCYLVIVIAIDHTWDFVGTHITFFCNFVKDIRVAGSSRFAEHAL